MYQLNSVTSHYTTRVLIFVKRREWYYKHFIASHIPTRHDADAQIQCPVEAGERAITQNVELPSHIPPGEY